MRISSAYNGSTGRELPSMVAELKHNSLSRITRDLQVTRMRIKSDCVELRTMRNSTFEGYAISRFCDKFTRKVAGCVSSCETNMRIFTHLGYTL